MTTQITRRRLITMGAGIAALGALPGGFGFGSAMGAEPNVRMTTGLRSTRQGMTWFAAEAGIFRKHGVNVSFPAVAVGGLQTAAGLIRGDWEFCTTGFLPVAESHLNGGDVVALIRTAVRHNDQFIAARRELTTLRHLDSQRFGVTSDAYSGGVGVRARVTLENAGATATYVGLGSFENIYAALARGEIDAGVLPIHMRFSGEMEHRWNIFELTGFEADVPSVLATTRRLIASNRDLVMRVVKANVEAIHAFKTRPAVFVPLVQRFLELDDRKVAEDMHKFYAPLFPPVPRVALREGLPALRKTFSGKYPAAERLQEPDVVDSSFIDELEKSGFVRRLYAAELGASSE